MVFHPSPSQPAATHPASPAPLLFEPFDSVLVRAPLLPLEVYHALSQGGTQGIDPLSNDNGTRAPHNVQVRRALAVGSSALLEALERAAPADRDAARLRGKLLRFLIRMSTRPTPYGLFAGVALAQWGPRTDLALACAPRTRTRPDMEWLLRLVFAQEARPEVRTSLRLIANPAAVVRAGRIVLAEQAATGPGAAEHDTAAPTVSVRATGVARRALALAHEPIPCEELAAALLATTPNATPEKVERLIAELCQHTLLLTDLRPPVTAAEPARYVARRLAAMPAARDIAAELQEVVDAATAWDALAPEESVAAYRTLAARAAALMPSATPLQVDMALALSGRTIAREVGLEAARAAELLVRLTPAPRGPAYLAAYRGAFEARYGSGRDVPLLELLDAELGLGSPLAYTGSTASSAAAALRTRTLLNLAHTALHDHRTTVEMDASTLARLETWTGAPDTAPLSLDLYAFVTAPSAEAIDAGNFMLIVGPNLGAPAAGRNLGRFSDLLGQEATATLERIARAEEAHAPDRLWAELVYLPHHLRSANVLIRPAVRRHEITLDASAGVPSARVIRLNELVVGVRDGRFYVRWPAANAEVVACTGHMLNYRRAPLAYRFLADVSRDGQAQLGAFDWGPARGFPFLPRVQAGRIVLSPAQWQIDALACEAELPPDPAAGFTAVLERWRAHWHVPRHVYLSTGDNRLLLDLCDAAQAAELRAELRRLGGGRQVVLHEALPALDQVWTPGPGGHFVTELVVSLVRRPAPGHAAAVEGVERPLPGGRASPRPTPAPAVEPGVRLRPPGSEWLFARLYCVQDTADELVAGPVRHFAENAQAAGTVQDWFFIRYADPDAHLRLRLRGKPSVLAERLLPDLCAWAAELMATERCLRFCIDTYEREVERYGGAQGVEIAERLFAADSRAVAALLHLVQARVVSLDRTTLGVLSVDDLLAGLGLSEAERLEWYAQNRSARSAAGDDYRQRKALLRPLLGDPARLLAEPGGDEISRVLAERRAALAPLAARLARLWERGELAQEPSSLYGSYVHMHCNRLLGLDHGAERTVIGLLARTREGLARAPQGR